TLLSTIFISCATKDSDKKEENSIKNEVTGIYSNDTTAIGFKTNGTCDIITVDSILPGEYVWDVDTTTILVTDRNQNITIFRAINKDTLISHKNSIFYKKK
ncbi:MAG: hypothetical protein KIG42_05935, partial [Paludibacteraceae bacterium]|nr:hypothetical protein [Paludibacteraceae bacterium]